MRRGRIGIGKERIKVYPGIRGLTGEPVFEKKERKKPVEERGSNLERVSAGGDYPRDGIHGGPCGMELVVCDETTRRQALVTVGLTHLRDFWGLFLVDKHSWGSGKGHDGTRHPVERWRYLCIRPLSKLQMTDARDEQALMRAATICDMAGTSGGEGRRKGPRRGSEDSAL
jgi:hypothetical protein